MIHSILVFLLLALCSGDILNSKITKENTLNAKKKKGGGTIKGTHVYSRRAYKRQQGIL